MSTSQNADITIELSFSDGWPLASIHFNSASITQKVRWTRKGGSNSFLEAVRFYSTSTVEQIYPPLDKRSADSARHTQTKTIAVSNHNEHPVAPELLRMVVDLTDHIMEKWAEVAVLTGSGEGNPF